MLPTIVNDVCCCCVPDGVQKLEGTPDEPVPESVANELQPFVAHIQKSGYEDRMKLRECLRGSGGMGWDGEGLMKVGGAGFHEERLRRPCTD